MSGESVLTGDAYWHRLGRSDRQKFQNYKILKFLADWSAIWARPRRWKFPAPEFERRRPLLDSPGGSDFRTSALHRSARSQELFFIILKGLTGAKKRESLRKEDLFFVTVSSFLAKMLCILAKTRLARVPCNMRKHKLLAQGTYFCAKRKNASDQMRLGPQVISLRDMT